MMDVYTKLVGEGPNVYPRHGPEYASALASGFDLRAAIPDRVVVHPVGDEVVPTVVPLGIALAFPACYELQLRPRSGLGSKHGLNLANTPGTIDADYRGELKAALVVLGDEPFTVEPGARIVQGVLAPVVRADRFVLTNELPASGRGEDGLGASGTE